MNLPPIISVNCDYQSVPETPVRNRRIMTDIVVVDQTDHHTVKPLLYLLREETAHLIENGTSIDNSLLNSTHEPFILMGEILDIDRKNKSIKLVNDNIISYKHLIIFVGASSHEKNNGDADLFSPGVHTLAEALKMRREGLKPTTSLFPSPSSASTDKSTSVFNISPALDSKDDAFKMLHAISNGLSGKNDSDQLQYRARLFEVHL